VNEHTRLEGMLLALGREIEVPPIPAIASSARARLERERLSAPEKTWRIWGVRWQTAPVARLAGIAAALVFVVAGALVAASPTAREAIADFIGIGGVRVRAPSEMPTPAPGSGLDIGQRVSLAEAQAAVHFAVALPQLPPYSEPDFVYLDERFPTRVTLLYGAEPRLPAAAGRVGMLITQFEAGETELVAEKLLGRGTGIRLVEVDGARGYWISGEPHVFFYVGKVDVSFEEIPRLAANTLLWERPDGLTIRIESELSLKETLRIARSL
jgi:hypothetical protein